MSNKLLEDYHISESMDIIDHEFSKFFEHDSHYRSLEQVRRDFPNPSRRLVTALTNVFKFQRALGAEDKQQKQDDRKKRLMGLYCKFYCTQKEAAKTMGLAPSTIGVITRGDKQVMAAYKFAKRKREELKL